MEVDSLGWRNLLFYNEPYVLYYHKHQAYNEYPVVNISHEKANEYCKWLTIKYNSNPYRKYNKVLFRLPTKNEWEIAAAGGEQLIESKYFPWQGNKIINEKGQYLANFSPIIDMDVMRDSSEQIYVRPPSVSYHSDYSIYTSKCKSHYPPNEIGLYNMAGNVAEYIQTKRKVKGGSFISLGYYLLIKTDSDEFKNQENGGSHIGFRPFMEILKK